MGDRDHTKFIVPDVVNDAVGKPSNQEAAPVVSPWGADKRFQAKEVEGLLKLGDEFKTEFPAALPGIEDAPSVNSRSASWLTEGVI